MVLNAIVALEAHVAACATGVSYNQGNLNASYAQFIADARGIGAAIAYHASKCAAKIPDLKIQLAGFSLGGQIVSEAGRAFEKLAGRKTDNCIALDPAGPGFEGCDDLRLTRHSCKTMHAV